MTDEVWSNYSRRLARGFSMEVRDGWDSDDNWSRLTLGWTLLRRQRFDESEEQFERALALNRNDAGCMSWAALTHPTKLRLKRVHAGYLLEADRAFQPAACSAHRVAALALA